MRLFSNGELVQESEQNLPYIIYQAPPESARYRVEFEAKRTPRTQLSTQITIAWEFASQTTPVEGAGLPVAVVRFAPELDDRNSAPLSAQLSIPIVVLQQHDSSAKPPESLTVEVSFDDSVSWTEADVTGSDNAWTTQAEHPQQSGFVSLRASAIDADDNLVEQTILRAYRSP